MTKLNLILFQWQARNTFGEKQKGKMIAENKQQVKNRLFQQGLTPLRLTRHYHFHSHPNSQQIYEFFHQLSLLLVANIPLKTALSLLQQDCQHLLLHHWLTGLIQDLNAGFSFSHALIKQGKYINAQDIQLIKVGELTGKLAPLCANIAQNKQQKQQLQRKLQKILLYPVVVLSIALCLTLALLLFVVPQFSQIYTNHPNALPAITKVLLFLSQFLWDKGGYILIISSILLVIITLFMPRLFSKITRYFLQHAPIFASLFPLARQHFVAENLAIMLQAGIPLKEALQSFLSQTTPFTDPIIIKEIQRVIQRLSQGYAFSASLTSAIFPHQSQQMLKIGEKTGNLALMLKHIAKDAHNKLSHRIDLLTQLLEPILMLIIGGLIGLTMLGMYLPIFDMGAIL